MNKSIVLIFLSIGLISCKHSAKQIDKLDVAKRYYKALDHSDGASIKLLLTDSLLTKIPAYAYEETFSSEDYTQNWLKWDAVFDPSYEILNIVLENGVVIAEISKLDKRIAFLHEKPFVISEVLSFQKDKIMTIETSYLNFDEHTWDKNKTELLEWIDKIHPELNGFIYDQTEKGGLKFLKAINLYKNQK